MLWKKIVVYYINFGVIGCLDYCSCVYVCFSRFLLFFIIVNYFCWFWGYICSVLDFIELYIWYYRSFEKENFWDSFIWVFWWYWGFIWLNYCGVFDLVFGIYIDSVFYMYCEKCKFNYYCFFFFICFIYEILVEL